MLVANGRAFKCDQSRHFQLIRPHARSDRDWRRLLHTDQVVIVALVVLGSRRKSELIVQDDNLIHTLLLSLGRAESIRKYGRWWVWMSIVPTNLTSIHSPPPILSLPPSTPQLTVFSNLKLVDQTDDDDDDDKHDKHTAHTQKHTHSSCTVRLRHFFARLCLKTLSKLIKFISIDLELFFYIFMTSHWYG